MTLQLFLVISLLAAAAAAQSPLGKLAGTVQGAEREGLSGVTVRLAQEGPPHREFKTITNASGEFTFLGVPAGSYTLRLESPGGQAQGSATLQISPGSTQDLMVTLVPSAPSKPAASVSVQVLSRGGGWGTNFSNLSKLPDARNIWSLLESQEPSTVTNRLDVGGLETGVPALFGALGASWTENEYSLNGFNVTDPYVPGRPLLDPEMDSLQELQVASGAKPAWFSSSGVALALATSEPPQSFHGAARLFYSGSGMQSDNLDARLRRLRFPGPERVNHLVDDGAQLGGTMPLSAAAWPFFLSLSTQQIKKELGGFAAPIDVRVYRSLAELTPVARGAQRLNLLLAGQHVFNSREDASPLVTPSATARGNDNYHQFQTRWDRTFGSSSLLALGVGATHAIISSGIQPGLEGASTLDLPLMTRIGAAPLSTAGQRTRYQASALYEVAPGRWAGSHNFDLGMNWDRSYISNRWDSFGGIKQVLVEGLGEEVIRWNTPAQARQHVQDFGLFAQDAWRPFKWLRVQLGLRLETSSGEAVGAQNSIRWANLEPRTGLVIPLRHRGLVLRASWSRYAHLLQGSYLDFGDPFALGEQVYHWQDVNGDGQAQPREIGQRLRVSGGPYSAVDRGLLRPFSDEISLGLEQGFNNGFNVSVRFFRRDDHRLVALINQGVPFSDYTPVTILDPGNDGIPGTTDDARLTLYNQNPSSLGRDFLLLTNPPGDRASAKGFEIRLAKPLVRSWEFAASFTATQTLAPTSPGNSVFENDTGYVGSLYTDPNTLLFDTSRTYFDRAFVGKANAYYLAPHGIRVGVVAKYYDGLPFGRLLFVDGFNQGPFFVRTTLRGHPGGFQTQFNGTLDVRVAREFGLPRGSLAGYLDCFNCLNMNRNTLEADLTGPTFQSRVPLAIEAPRLARLGVEWRF